MSSYFKVKFEFRGKPDLHTEVVYAANPQSAADQVRKKYANQQIVVVTVKAAKAPVAA